MKLVKLDMRDTENPRKTSRKRCLAGAACSHYHNTLKILKGDGRGCRMSHSLKMMLNERYSFGTNIPYSSLSAEVVHDVAMYETPGRIIAEDGIRQFHSIAPDIPATG